MAEPKQPKKLAVLQGGLNIAKRLLADGEEAGMTATQRAEAGRKAAELIKQQEQIKASEALGQLMEKGVKRTTTTQADRTRVGGGNIGGASFSAISQADPNYAGKVWGVMDEGTAARLKNLTAPDTAWTTMLGSANQLKTNPLVFEKLKRGFVSSMKEGNLSDELAGKINHNLALTFGEGADIRDPKIWRQADTFEKRAALADLMMGQGIAPSKGGLALGGEKSGKGVIFKPTDILKRETEPTLLHTEHGGDVPTFAAGPRLFKLEKESEYRPDLHPGFPTLLKGEDLGVNMKPTPTEVYLPDWHARFKKNNPERKAPGYYDLALGVKGEGLPSQELNDEYIRHLLREGFKDGGSVDIDAADARLSKAIEERMSGNGMAKGGSVDIAAADARLEAAMNARMGMAQGGEAGFKKIEFMADGGKLVKGLGKLGKRLLADPSESSMVGRAKFGDEMGGNTIVKDVGGNWLSGSVEKSVKPLRQKLDRAPSLSTINSEDPAAHLANMEKIWTPEKIAEKEGFLPRIRTAVEETKADLRPKAALNDWVDRNLTNYIKKQMATPNDPIRKLAEEGITHLPADTRMPPNMSSVNESRKMAGFPEPMGKSPLAQTWEAWADKPIGFDTAGVMQNIGKGEPWMDKVDPFTRVHGIAPNYQNHMFTDLGFDHIVDVLKADLAAGRIRPEQLNKVSIEDAVKRTHQYNEDLAKKMQEARMAEIPAAKVHKEYPEGYKWVQLDQPGQFAHESDVMGHSVRGYEPPQEHPDWIGHSGEEGYGGYGHGGWEGIKSGKAKIYSLRDPKGQAHATIEIGQPKLRTWDDVTKSVGKEKAAALHKEFYDIGADRTDDTEAAMAMFLKNKGIEPLEYISQVKGKQNKAPNEEYLPYIQDFVKGGKWSDVRDFGNTGLIREGDQIMTPAEHGDWLLNQLKERNGGVINKAEGGGAFKKIQWFDGGGIAAQEFVDPFADARREPILTKKDWENVKRNAPEVYDWAKQNVKDEASQLKTAKGVKDFALRTGAQYAGGIPDLVNLGLMGVDALADTNLSSEKPWFGSEQYIDAMHKSGMLGENEFPIAETVAGILAPAGLIKKGAKKVRNMRPVKDEPKKRLGGLTAMAR